MERELVVRASLGDHDAFAELVERVASRCQSTAVQILRDEALAQDAAQEALVRAWRDLPRLRDPDRFEAWIRRLLV
ncbi:MAG: RNA polymerase sigma factor, partial [Chloroflexota bacterium]|nr:RNA polymerase sigma factor [Chloroflexota bacterium]